MNPWEIKIKKADNGYVMDWVEENDDELFPHSIAVEEPDMYINDTLKDLATFREMIWDLMEFFGVHGSKHSYRLYLTIKNEQTGKEVEDLEKELIRG